MHRKKGFIFLIASAIFLFSSTLRAGAAWPDGWLNGAQGFEKAESEAKASGRPFLTYFYATWCPHCKAFQKKVLSNPAFESALLGTSKVRIDVEKDEAIAEEFEVDSFPRVFVVFPNGNAEEIPAVQNPEEFLSGAREAGLVLSEKP